MNDSRQIAEVEERLRSCSLRLHKLAPMVGSAKQIREFSTDRKKNLLAKYVVRALKEGHSATAAEAYGRSDEAYQAQLDAMSREYEASEKTLAEWEAEQCSFEAARSLLSMAKETLKTLEG